MFFINKFRTICSLFILLIFLTPHSSFSSICRDKFNSQINKLADLDPKLLHQVKTMIPKELWQTQWGEDYLQTLAVAKLDHSSHLRTLAEFGFKQEKQNGKREFVLPDNLAVLVQKYHKRMQDYVEKGLLQEEDILWPTILFYDSRKDQMKPEKYIRLGLDPFPDMSIWRHYTIPFVSNPNNFAFNMSRGRFLLQLGTTKHDLAHITDLYNDPSKMKAIKNSYKQQMDIRKNFGTESANSYERMMILDEFWSAAKLEKQDHFREIFPEFYRHKIGNFKTAYVALRKIKELNNSAFLKKVRRFKNLANTFFSKSGGAMRDLYNLEKNGYSPSSFFIIQNKNSPSEKKKISYLQNIVLNSIYSSPLDSVNIVKNSAMASIYTHFFRINEAYRVISEEKYLKAYANLLKVSVSKVTEEFQNYIAYHMAIIIMSYKNAVELNITPAKLIDELSIGSKADSDSRQYIIRSFPVSHLYHRVFIND